jgi:hypothetical protein
LNSTVAAAHLEAARRHNYFQKKGVKVTISSDFPIKTAVEYALEQFKSYG